MKEPEIKTLSNKIGILSNLTTTDKTNLVNSIREIGSDLADSMQENGGCGIVEGFEVSAKETPDMSVSVNRGTFHKSDGTKYVFNEPTTVTINTADSTHRRKDIIYINKNTGEIGYTVGTTLSTKGTRTYTVTNNFVPQTLGTTTYTITTNAANNDTVTIFGVIFTAKTSGANGIISNQFNIGADTTETATNLKNLLNLNTTINTVFTATSTDNVITLTEKTVGLNTPPLATKTGTIVITSSVVITSNINKFTLNNIVFTATSSTTNSTNFAVGSTIADTIVNIVSALSSNALINNYYSISYNSTTFTLTEKVSGNGITSSFISVTGTGGTITNSSITTGTTGTAPTVGSDSLLLAEISVLGGVTTIVPLNIADKRFIKLNNYGVSIRSTNIAIYSRKFKPTFGVAPWYVDMDQAGILSQINDVYATGCETIPIIVHVTYNSTDNTVSTKQNINDMLYAYNQITTLGMSVCMIKFHFWNFDLDNITNLETFKTNYKALITTWATAFQGKSIQYFTVLNEQADIYLNVDCETFVIECLNIPKTYGFKVGVSTMGWLESLRLSDNITSVIDGIFMNCYPQVSFKLERTTIEDSISAWDNCLLVLRQLKGKFPTKPIVISETGCQKSWESLTNPGASTWNTGGYSSSLGKAPAICLQGLFKSEIQNYIDMAIFWYFDSLYYDITKNLIKEYTMKVGE